MKTLLFTLLTAASLTSYSQDLEIPAKVGLPLKDNQVIYEVVDSIGATKAQLYTAFKAAMVEIFKGYAIKLDDKEAGLIIGKGSIPFTFKLPVGNGDARAFFTYQLQAKDGRYRVQLKEWEGAITGTATEGSPILEVYTKGIMKSAKYRERYLTGFHEVANLALTAFDIAIKKNLQSISNDF